jgi:hypothetical protein
MPPRIIDTVPQNWSGVDPAAHQIGYRGLHPVEPVYPTMTADWLEAIAWEWRRLVQKRWGQIAETEIAWTPSRGLWRASIVLGVQTYRVEARRAPEAMDKALTAAVASERK